MLTLVMLTLSGLATLKGPALNQMLNQLIVIYFQLSALP
jgi:hypothetical protein